MVLLAIYNVWLSKLSGQEDIVVGVPLAGRIHDDLNGVIGMFLNTLALRSYPVHHKTFKDFLTEIRTKTLAGFENQDYQFEDLVEKLEVQRYMNRNPVFDVVLNFQNYKSREENFPSDDSSDLMHERYQYENQIAMNDITLYSIERSNDIFFSLEYRTALFKEETIERYIKYFKKVVSDVLTNNEIELGKIDISCNLIPSNLELNQAELDDFGF
jgi:non-ribosomal peptide synthetase component F